MTEKVIETVIPEGSSAENIGELETAKIQQTIDLGYDTGLIKNKADINTSIDASYWTEATKQLKGANQNEENLSKRVSFRRQNCEV